MKIDPETLATGGAVADVLRFYPNAFFCSDASATLLHTSTHSFVPDGQFADRLKAVPKSHFGGRGIDLSHDLLLDAATRTPLWQPIEVPPAYFEVPPGSLLHSNRGFVPELDQRFTLAVDAVYFGGQLIPAGTVVRVAGFKTSLGYRTVVFTTCAQFPDGTFRNLPWDAVPV